MSYESFAVEEELNASHASAPLPAESDASLSASKLQQAANRQRVYLRKKTITKLRELLKRNALILYFQPILYSPSLKISGASAILKIQRQGIGPIPAQHILSLVEDSTILVDIGCWMVGQVLHRTKKFPRHFVFTLPVSAYLLRSVKFVSYVINSLNNLKIASGRLQFALTDEVICDDLSDLDAPMQSLAEAGVTFSVTHHGTIEKALNMLEEGVFSTLVLDKYLVKSALESKEQNRKLNALCKTIHAYNCAVRVMGVESTDMITSYTAMGIDELQGSAIATAVPMSGLLPHAQQTNQLELSDVE